jgi:hypothetical protein
MACGDGHPIAKGCFRINRDDGIGIGIGEGPPLQRIDRGAATLKVRARTVVLLVSVRCPVGGRVGVFAIDKAQIAIGSGGRSASFIVT